MFSLNDICFITGQTEILPFLFAEIQWKKYNGHCYYYGSDRRSWFLAEVGFILKLFNWLRFLLSLDR